MFYLNYVALCNASGKSPSAVAEELGLSRATVTHWGDGSVPRQATLQKVANYFGVSVDDLLAESAKKQRPADGEALISELPEDIQNLIEICKERPALASALLAVAQQIETRSSAQE